MLDSYKSLFQNLQLELDDVFPSSSQDARCHITVAQSTLEHLKANQRASEERQALYNRVLNQEHSVDGQLVAADVLRKNLYTIFNQWQRNLGEKAKAIQKLQELLSDWSACNDVLDHVLSSLEDVAKLQNEKFQNLNSDLIRQTKKEALLDLSREKLRCVEDNLKSTSDELCKEDGCLLHARFHLAVSSLNLCNAQSKATDKQLQNRLERWRHFEEKYKEAGQWLQSLEELVALSAEQDFDKIYEGNVDPSLSFDSDDVGGWRENMIEVAEQAAAAVIGNSDVQKMMSKLQDRWKYLQGIILARKRKVNETVNAVGQLDNSLHGLRSWLGDAESQLFLPLVYQTCSEKEIQRKAHQHQDLQKAIDMRGNGVTSVLHLCEVLMQDPDACASQENKKSIEEASKSLDQRWRKICALSMDRRFKIEDTQRSWKRFLLDFSSFSDWLIKCETVAKQPRSSEVTYEETRKELKNYETFQRHVHEGLSQLEMINKQYRTLARESRTDAAHKLKMMVREGNRRWDDLSQRVAAVIRRLKQVVEKQEAFETLREACLVWLTESEIQLTNIEHFMDATNEEKLKLVEEIESKVSARLSSLHDLDERARDLISSCHPSDGAAVGNEMREFYQCCRDVLSQLERCHKRLLHLLDRTDDDLSLYGCGPDELARLSWWEMTEAEDDNLLSVKSNPADQRVNRSGRLSPYSNGSLEWDSYDIAHPQLAIDSSDSDQLLDDTDLGESVPVTTQLIVSPPTPAPRSPITARVRLPDQQPPGTIKRRRTKSPVNDEQRERLLSDLHAMISWLEITYSPAIRQHANSDEIVEQGQSLQLIEEEMKSRKPLLLSVNLIASRLSASDHDNHDVTDKVKRMNSDWRRLHNDVEACKQELCLHVVEACREVVTAAQSWIDLCDYSTSCTSDQQQTGMLHAEKLSRLQQVVDVASTDDDVAIAVSHDINVMRQQVDDAINRSKSELSSSTHPSIRHGKVDSSKVMTSPGARGRYEDRKGGGHELKGGNCTAASRRTPLHDCFARKPLQQDGSGTLFYRVLKSALVISFVLFLLLYFLQPYCDDFQHCSRRNNLYYSWYPALTSVDGPPPT